MEGVELGFIRLSARVVGANSSSDLEVLLDTGARRNVIRRTLDSRRNVYSIGISTYRGPITLRLANDDALPGEDVEFPGLDIMGRRVEPVPFVIVDKLKEEAILGALTMQRLGLTLHPQSHSVRFD